MNCKNYTLQLYTAARIIAIEHVITGNTEENEFETLFERAYAC